MSDTHDEPEVIDSAEWLQSRAEEAILSGDPAAVGYLERLILVAENDVLVEAYSNLGVAYFRDHRLSESRAAFEQAELRAPANPVFAYALGHCEAASGKWWRSLYRFVQALYLGRGSHEDTAEHLRSAAVAARHLKLSDLAEDLLLGARERKSLHPQVLESLGRLYEQQERWLEAIRVRDELIEVLKGNDPRRAPRLLSPAIENTPATDSRLAEHRRGLNARIRQGFQVVDETTESQAPDAQMSRTAYPVGLHTLIENLSENDRALDLLETAQSIWARARHERFDAHLTPYTLAAATQWVTERLRFAVPTDVSKLEADYGVKEEQIRAAARLLVSQFNIRVISPELVMRGLGAPDGAHLLRMLQAMVMDADIDSLDPLRMLI